MRISIGQKGLKAVFGVALVFVAAFATPMSASADYTQRFTFGVGLWHMNNPSQTDFELGAEYEHRTDALLGLGLEGNYIFSSPGIGLLGAPAIFLHPLGTEWFVSGAPLFEFGSGINTHVGVRLGTRLPLPLGLLVLVPSASVDIISGGPNFIIGLGIEI